MTARRQVKLVTFASAPFYAQQNLLNESAPAGGITECIAWNEVELRATDFYKAHRDIFDARRGFGYWLWKPYVIRQALDHAKNGDFIVYWDVGRPSLPNTISRPLAPLLDWCEQHNAGMLPGVYVPEHGPNTKWIKRECFVLMDCDAPMYWEHPQIQATYSIWQKSERSQAFVEEWLQWCTRRDALADEIARPDIENFPDFVDHRHDQAISTLLAIKQGVKCYGEPGVRLPGSKDINNLVDRILGNETSIIYRNLRRTIGRIPRAMLLTYRKRSLKLSSP
jgi:hypothetical protein